VKNTVSGIKTPDSILQSVHSIEHVGTTSNIMEISKT